MNSALSRLSWKFAATAGLASVMFASAVDAADKIYVKLYVDEEERAVESRWKDRLRRRLQHASQIIDGHAGIRFHLSDFGKWLSDNHNNEFADSLKEFEREVSVGRDEIAVGFTSQYRFTPGRHHLGGTRGPLHTHILIREANPRTVESERLEVLVHELGHFLGAVHSARKDSVMRPVIGDGQARSRSFQIVFDPVNTRIMHLVADEVRYLNVHRFHQLTDSTKRQLHQLYQRMAEELPDDPAAQKVLRMAR